MASTNLITTFYDEPNAHRRHELELCLSLNASAFDDVTVLTETRRRHGSVAAEWIDCRNSPRFADAMDHCASGDVVNVIANADIIFPDNSLATIQRNLRPFQVYCLTRWDFRPGGIYLFDEAHSGDAWVFRGRPKADIGGDYLFGDPGSDNKFPHELKAAGYEVLNPSCTIKIYHLHLSRIRNRNNFKNRVPGPYLLVPPHELGERPKCSRPVKISRAAGKSCV